MNHRQIIESCLTRVLAKLPDERLREVFDFAEFLAMKEEGAAWSRASAAELAKLYAEDEPDYSSFLDEKTQPKGPRADVGSGGKVAEQGTQVEKQA